MAVTSDPFSPETDVSLKHSELELDAHSSPISPDTSDDGTFGLISFATAATTIIPIANAAEPIAPKAPISNAVTTEPIIKSFVNIKNPLEYFYFMLLTSLTFICRLFASRKASTEVLQNTLLANSTSRSEPILNSAHSHDDSEILGTITESTILDTNNNEPSLQVSATTAPVVCVVTPQDLGLSRPACEMSNGMTLTSWTTGQLSGIPIHAPSNATAVAGATITSEKAWHPPSNKTGQLVFFPYYHHHTDDIKCLGHYVHTAGSSKLYLIDPNKNSTCITRVSLPRRKRYVFNKFVTFYVLTDVRTA